MSVGNFRYKLIISLYWSNLFLLSLDNNAANRIGLDWRIMDLIIIIW